MNKATKEKKQGPSEEKKGKVPRGKGKKGLVKNEGGKRGRSNKRGKGGPAKYVTDKLSKWS